MTANAEPSEPTHVVEVSDPIARASLQAIAVSHGVATSQFLGMREAVELHCAPEQAEQILRTAGRVWALATLAQYRAIASALIAAGAGVPAPVSVEIQCSFRKVLADPVLRALYARIAADPGLEALNARVAVCEGSPTARGRG